MLRLELNLWLHFILIHFTILFSGEVGDWQNYFTEEENEQFDKLLKDHFKDSDWKFTYNL